MSINDNNKLQLSPIINLRNNNHKIVPFVFIFVEFCSRFSGATYFVHLSA